MKQKLFIASLIILFYSTLQGFSFEFNTNQERILLKFANDKISYGISHNLDDQYTFAYGFDFLFPYFHFQTDFNSITNRGYKSDLLDSSSFVSGRYDEFNFFAGTDINLFSLNNFNIDIEPELGLSFLGNFGMEFLQNQTHKINKVSALVLPYEKFDHNICPIINANLSVSYNILPKLKTSLSCNFENTIFYATHQNLVFDTKYGSDKTIIEAFTGYRFTQKIDQTPTHIIYEDYAKGYNFGYYLDSGLFVIEYIAYTSKRFGYATIYLDILNLKNKTWDESNLYLSTGLSSYLNTTFQELQVQHPLSFNDNLYIIFNNKFLSGYKINPYLEKENYRMERDYDINSIGLKYEFDIPQINNFITPYLELASGFSTFGLKQLLNHDPDAEVPFIDYGTKYFSEIEFTAGIDLLPEDLFTFGSSSYKLSFFVGTVVIPGYKKASAQIKKDTYRTADWKLNLFEFRYGFSIKMGLDF